MGISGILFFGLSGLVVIYFGVLGPDRRAREAATWPEVSCSIERTDIKSFQDTDEEIEVTRFRPVVEFSYAFGGQTWRSDCLNLSVAKAPACVTREEAGSLLKPYAEKAPTTCRVNPLDPSRAVLRLEPGPVGTGHLILLGFLVFLPFGLMASFWLPLLRPESPEDAQES